MKRILLFIICIFSTIAGFPNTSFGYKVTPFQSFDLQNNSQQYSLSFAESRDQFKKVMSDEYAVSISASPASGGTLSGSGIYNYGNNVTVNATPRQGYIFANWTENGTLISTSSTYSFIINSNRNLVANFTAYTYSVSATVLPSAGGSLSGSGTYNYGSIVTLNATPASGYIFRYWAENGAQISENSFYSFTVKSNRAFVANFAPIAYNGIITASAAPVVGGNVSGEGTYMYGSVATLAANPNTGYNFTNWTENGTIVSTTPAYSFTVGGNRSLIANFTIRTNIISVTSSPAAGGTASGNGTYNYGSVVNLNATPNAGYSFVSWTENGSLVSTSSTYSFTIIANRSLVANFAPGTNYTLLAYALPSASGVVSGGGIYVYGSLVTLNTNPGKGYSFINWTENGTQVSTSTSYSFTINSDRTVIANYAPLRCTVLTSALPTPGGTVSGSGTYNYSEAATLTATANTGYTFTNWTENGTMVSTSPAYSFTVEGSKTLTANFTVNTHIISATATPAEGGSANGSGTYNYGSEATLKAIPAAGYSFVNWTENGTQLSNSSTFIFKVSSNRSIRANFTLNPDTYSISAKAAPSAGGTVSGGKAYINGSLAVVTALPNTGYSFTNWTENGTVVSTNPAYSFTVSKSRNLNANFRINTQSMTVTALPAQGGTVSGSGIYDYGSIVTLSAAPGTGYSFTNWTENGVIVSTSPAYSFTIIADRTLVANFMLNPGTASIITSAAPSTYGSVSDSKTYAYGSVAAVTATPNSGYSFTNWTESGIVVSTNPTYNFTVAGSRTLIANFTVITNNISLTVSPVAAGTVEGAGTYNYGSAVTLKAIPATGYRFVNWTENGTEVSNSSIYSFAINTNRNIVANFTLNTFSILISPTPAAGGVLSGGRTYDYGSVATLNASASAGYIFTGWTEGGTLVNSDSTYSFTVTQNRTLLANFILRTQMIFVTASPAEGGTVSGGGTYEYGNVLTLYTIPMNGYRFANWSENGSVISTSSTYSFTINSDRALVANYTPVAYVISASALPSAGGIVGGGKTYDHGSTATLTAKVNPGYSFINWTEDGSNVSADSVYSFSVERHRSLIANYQIKTYTISVSATPVESGDVSGGGKYNYGSVVFLNATPAIGYNFINWTENGIQVSISSVLSIPVDADRTFVANFSHNTSNIGIIQASVSPAAGGSVSGSKSYDFGSVATVKAIANSGYSFSSWTEGGVVVSTDSIYSFTVDRSRTIIADFTINTHIISVTASNADGGFVTGGGTYNYGSIALINATPYIGYTFVNWTENGEILSTNSSFSFTVVSNRDLLANFISGVGLEDNSFKETLMYPNPAHDILYFVFPSHVKTVVTIFDNSGHIVLTSFKKTINISHLATGTYLVKVNEQVFKLVKL